MITWISENISTIIIALVLAAAVAGIIIHMVRGKRKGGSSCGCGCGGCSMSGVCHSHKK